jgi:hypothetical protein
MEPRPRSRAEPGGSSERSRPSGRRTDHARGTALRDRATLRPTAAYRVQASSRPGETSLKSRENRDIPPARNRRYLADSTRYTEPPNSRWAAKMLPLNLSGIVMVDQPSASSKSPEGALTSILARLEREKASNLSQTRNRVDFKGGVFRFAWNWNQLVAISHGEIRVERAATGLSKRSGMQPHKQFQRTVTRRRGRTCAISLCTCGALDSAARGR